MRRAIKKLKKNKLFIIKALMLGFSAIITKDDKFGNSEFNKDIIFDNESNSFLKKYRIYNEN